MAATGNVELGQGLCVPEWVMEVVILEPFRCGVEVWFPPTAPPRTVPEKGKRKEGKVVLEEGKLQEAEMMHLHGT